MKKCSKCKLNKSKSDFGILTKPYKCIRSQCRSCEAEYSREYRDRMPPEKKAESIAKLKKWQEENPERVVLQRKKHNKIGWHKREARKKNLICDLTDRQWQETLRNCDYKCVYCGALWEHQDHFVPLSNGGGYTVNNMVPSCSPCNLSKANKDPFEYIRYPSDDCWECWKCKKRNTCRKIRWTCHNSKN